MTLRAQVVGGLAVLLLLSTGLALYQLSLTRELSAANRQLADVDLELSRSSLRIRRDIDQLEELTRRYKILRDPDYLAELERLRDQVEGEIQRLESLSLPDMGPITALRRLWRRYEELAATLEERVSARKNADAELAAVRDAIEQPRELVRRLDRVASERADALIAMSIERAAAARRATWLVTLLGVALTAALALWIGRTTARPLRALTRGAEAMAAGDFAHRVDVQTPRELAILARDFNLLADRLGELDQMKRDFLSSVSHDLKAPLASIQETTRLVLERDSSLAEDDRYLLALSARSAERLEGMIGDLLDIARLEAGAVTYQLEPLDLEDCCEEALDRAASLFAHKRIEVKRGFAEEALMVEADLPLLLQALGNLLSNAAKFSPEGGSIGVRTGRVEGDRARLEIEDQGPGVPASDKTRIFDRFYTTPADATRPAGTGLGLAIVRSIIGHHQGDIRVEDGREGGSVFVVELPLVHRSDVSGSGSAPA